MRLLFCLFLIYIFALQTPARAEVLRVAMGLWLPPYIIKQENRGIEYEIIEESLAYKGHRMEPVYLPLARTLVSLQQNKVDGTMSTALKNLPGCTTDPHITYWNFAITLAHRNIEIKRMGDLANKNIVAFQNAKNYLGAEYQKLALENPNYREIANQSTQTRLLFTERTDVVVSDRFIFEWFSKLPDVKSKTDTSQKVTYHPLFEPTPYSAVFRKDHICKDFNAGLKHLRDTGRYNEIIASYGLQEPKFTQ